MFSNMVKQLKLSLRLLILMSLLTGIAYPLLVTALGELFFQKEANGSLIMLNGQPIGSRLIGQNFSSSQYFWPRPSATEPFPYNGAASSGSNDGPSNPLFLTKVRQRLQYIKESHPDNVNPVPTHLITASASGLDPEISPYAALYQSSRIANARKLPLKDVHLLIDTYTSNHLSLFGAPRVNVLQLNIALDKLRLSHDRTTEKS